MHFVTFVTFDVTIVTAGAAFVSRDVVLTLSCLTRANGFSSCRRRTISYIGIPYNAKRKFLPAKAEEIGCDPKLHYSKLANMEPVSLDNGNIVEPEMVTEKAPRAQAFALIFLPNADYIESFLQENQEFLNLV